MRTERIRRRRVAIAWLAMCVALVTLGGPRLARGGQSAADRVKALEGTVAQRRQAAQALEHENAEIQANIDAHPLDTGGGFSSRQQIHINQRTIDAYHAEIESLERQLVSAREAAAAEAAAPRPSRAAAASRPDSVKPGGGGASPSAGSGTAEASPPPRLTEPPIARVTGLGSGLDTAQVHELMRTWAHGETGVPGVSSALGLIESPLAVVMSGLDWSLDWRELSAGAGLGALVGALLPIGITALLKRFFPQRAPLIGTLSRKWTTVSAVSGSPSKQWVELSERSEQPVRWAATAAALVAAAVLAQAVASWFGFGAGLGTRRPWGEVVLLAVAVLLAIAAAGVFRKRSYLVALGLLSVSLAALAVPVARALTPFGGRGSVAWTALLAIATCLQVPAIRYLWQLASPRAVSAAPRQVAGFSAAWGLLVGFACAVFALLDV